MIVQGRLITLQQSLITMLNRRSFPPKNPQVSVWMTLRVFLMTCCTLVYIWREVIPAHPMMHAQAEENAEVGVDTVPLAPSN
jgi:hypothetical protein